MLSRGWLESRPVLLWLEKLKRLFNFCPSLSYLLVNLIVAGSTNGQSDFHRVNSARYEVFVDRLCHRLHEPLQWLYDGFYLLGLFKKTAWHFQEGKLRLHKASCWDESSCTSCAFCIKAAMFPRSVCIEPIKTRFFKEIKPRSSDSKKLGCRAVLISGMDSSLLIRL